MSEDRYSPAVRSRTQGLVIAAWILTFLMPPIGFILGVILTAKDRTAHGIGTMVVSVLWLPLLFVLFQVIGNLLYFALR